MPYRCWCVTGVDVLQTHLPPGYALLHSVCGPSVQKPGGSPGYRKRLLMHCKLKWFVIFKNLRTIFLKYWSPFSNVIVGESHATVCFFLLGTYLYLLVPVRTHHDPLVPARTKMVKNYQNGRDITIAQFNLDCTGICPDLWRSWDSDKIEIYGILGHLRHTIRAPW